MANILAGSLNGKFPLQQQRKLQVVSVVVNNECNLACRHCYLQTKPHDRYLTNTEWLKFFRSLLVDVNPQVLCFAGREIFASSVHAELFFDTIRLRDRLQKGKKTQIGVITNALLLEQYREQLLKIRPDYIDVSADGPPQSYDAVRGRGAFSRLVPNLDWLSRHFGDTLWLTPTLHKDNMFNLHRWVPYYHRTFNITRFSFGFYAHLPYTDQKLLLKRHDYRRFAQSIIPELENIKLRNPVNMVIELDANQHDLVTSLEEMGYLRPDMAFARDVLRLKNGLVLNFHVARKPVGLWKSVRVSPEGYWIAAEDLLRVREYPQLTTANVRECNYDANLLYMTGLDSRRYYSLYSQTEPMMVS